MIKKAWMIFLRDLKVAKRDFIAIMLVAFPVVIAFVINFLTPGINDTTVNLALIDGDPQLASYLSDFARVEVLPSEQAVQRRVEDRDHVLGVLPQGDGYYLLQQGNEPTGVVDLGKVLLTFAEQNLQLTASNAEISDFGRTVPPLTKMLVSAAILMASLFGGMVMALNVIEEKVDRTIRAIHLAPVSNLAFLLGKSVMGISIPLFGSAAIVLITGFTGINWLQLFLILLASTVISLLVGLVQGLTNDDFISSLGSMKLLFLPMAAGIVAVDVLAAKWQPYFYWNPFYWAYKGYTAILSQNAAWSEILLFSAVILALSALVYALLAPKIRHGLE